MAFIAPSRQGLALALFVVLAHQSPAAIRKGPYLIYPGSNTQMSILWQTDSPAACTLDWGTDDACQGGTVAVAPYGEDNQFQHLLTGLTPGRKYYFRVREEGQSYPGSFLAAPPAEDRSLKFLAYGDTRTNVGSDDAVSNAMIETFTGQPDFQTFALHVGDRVSADSETAWTREFFTRDGSGRNIARLISSLPLQGCLGDHEGGGLSYKKYWPYPYVNAKDYYWSFDYGPAHIAVIDQRDIEEGPSDEQVRWLQKDLAGTKKEWKFLVCHKPAWTALNLVHRNDARAQKVLQPLCVQYGVAICFCGHVHCYARCERQGVNYLTVGGGGAPRYSVSPIQPSYVKFGASTLHFVKIEINGHVLNCQAQKPDGTVLDTFTITHPQPAMTLAQ